MAHLVFATADAGGNVPPALGIATELHRRGHTVRFLGHQAQRSTLEQAGFGFTAYRRSPPWSPTELPSSQRKQLAIMLAGFTSRGMGQDLVELVHDDPADVVVIDTLLLGVLDAATRARLPHACLVHSLFAYFDGPFYHGPLGTLARIKHFNLRKLWRTSEVVLVCAHRGLDPAHPRSDTDHVVWTGPIRDDAARPADPASRRVLVSFSTGNFTGQTQVYQNALDAIATIPIDVTVTTGPAVDPSTLRAPPNATVHRYLPHDQVLPDCAAVISHGGHATTTRALAYDLPLLIIPMHPGLDQNMIGAAVTTAGAGLTLPKTASPEAIRQALTQLLDRPRYRTAAAELGADIRATNGAAVGADHLLQLPEEPRHP